MTSEGLLANRKGEKNIINISQGKRREWWTSSNSFLPRDLLRPAFLVLHLIHCPHCPLHVLHAHKALVQAEVVAHGILRVRGAR